MTRKATRQKRLDLWLDDADLAKLEEMAEAWQVSRQRIIESALTYAAATNMQPSADRRSKTGASDHYTRRQRIPVNLDGLALAQVDYLAAGANAVSDGIRTALRSFHAAQEARNKERLCRLQTPTLYKP